ncbi:MAG TPA: hypothetical protein VN922_01755, partial [Bacteroidia bacterium]|nr:hypothetical protein [Bacteroidia bacterium]
ITRKDAKALGLKNYFTGVPCKNGHIDLRYVCNHKCVACTTVQSKDWFKNNTEKAKKINKKWRDSNKEHKSQYNKEYIHKNSEKERERKKLYARANSEKINFLTASRRAMKFKATPTWADFFQIQIFYSEAKYQSKVTGIKHSVDHIVPLNHPLVCGLHNQFNLQVLTASENSKKCNRWWPDMPE